LESRTYNFQAGHKYTVVCGDDGEYLIFSVTDDGTFSAAPSRSPASWQSVQTVIIPKNSIKNVGNVKFEAKTHK
jgi:hypothetical protein